MRLFAGKQEGWNPKALIISFLIYDFDKYVEKIGSCMEMRMHHQKWIHPIVSSLKSVIGWPNISQPMVIAKVFKMFSRYALNDTKALTKQERLNHFF